MYKKDEKYIEMTKNMEKGHQEQFEEHFKEYDEIVEQSIKIYTSDGFRGTIFSTGAVGVKTNEPSTANGAGAEE